jgi:outer membrane autotransporter protein
MMSLPHNAESKRRISDFLLLTLLLLVTFLSFRAEAEHTLPTTPINFGGVNLNTSSSQTLTLQLAQAQDDLGAYNTIITGISTNGDFSVTHNCPIETIVSTTCTITVTYTPATLDASNGSLNIALTQYGDLTENVTETITLSGYAIAGEIISDRNSVDFGSVDLSSPVATQQILLTNTGNASVEFSRFSASSPLYTVTHDCPVTFNPEESCYVFVDINSNQLAATPEAELTVQATAPQGMLTHTIDLTATPEWGILTTSQNQLHFRDIPVGTTSPIHTFSVGNQGNQPLQDLSVSLSGQFRQSNDCPAQLNAGSSCTVSVIASPTSAGDIAGSLRISALSNTQTQSLSVALSVHATLADLALSTTELQFDETVVGTSSESQTVTLTNQGDDTLTVNSVTVAGDFSLTNNCEEEITASDSCELQIAFTPTAQGDASGTLSIDTNVGTFTVALAGSASTQDDDDTPVDPEPETGELTVSDTEVNFPESDVNGASDPYQLTLSNPGSAALPIHSISIDGDFTVSDNCGTALGAGERCELQITFVPKSSGNVTGVLSIETSQGISRITLTGSAVIADNPQLSPAEIVTLFAPYSSNNPNVASTIEAIAAACANGGISARMQEDCEALIAAATDGDLNTATALKGITPEAAGKANSVSRQGGQTQVRNLGARISALRAGTNGISLNGLNWRLNGENLSIAWLEEAYRKTRQKGGGASDDEQQPDSALGLFITGDIGSGSKEESELESGLDFNTYGLTLGIDYRINNQFILGSAFGLTDTQSDLDSDAGNLDHQGYSISLYGTYYSLNDYFIDFSTTYGINNFEQERRIAYQVNGDTEVNQAFMADYDGDTISLFIGSGYDFNTGAWSVGPRIDLEYLKSNTDEFTEESNQAAASGSGWTTRVESMNRTWLTLKLGGRVSYAHSTDWGVIIPYARLDWLHEFKDDAQTFNAYFTEDSSAQAIQITSDEPDRDYLRLRLGASTQFQNGITGFVDFATLMANSRWSSHNLSLGVRMEF